MEKLTKSEAKKKYWQSISKEERSRRASHAAKARQAKMTPEQKLAQSKRLIAARYGQ